MSEINKDAAARICNSPLGIALLQAFEQLEEQLESSGGEEIFTQVGFLTPQEQLKGGLIPSIHLSLRRGEPLLSEETEMTWDDKTED